VKVLLDKFKYLIVLFYLIPLDINIKSEKPISSLDKFILVNILLNFNISYINWQLPDRLLFLNMNVLIDLFLTNVFYTSLLILESISIPLKSNFLRVVLFLKLSIIDSKPVYFIGLSATYNTHNILFTFNILEIAIEPSLPI
jgi:hypothetical protein